MRRRTLGHSDLHVSEVGLGCWQFGGDFGPIEADTVESIIHAALACDINFFDTADVYGDGASEHFLGDHLATREPRPLIATKYGRGGGVYPDGYTEAHMRDSVCRALERLQIDTLDLLQLHCVPTEVMRHGAIFDWLRRLQQEGHIRHFGASVETVEEGLICAEQEGIVALQVIFNLFRQKLVDELLPVAESRQIGIIVRLPLASGLLSGKFTEQTRFEESDHRHFNRDGAAFNVGETFAGIPFKTGVGLAQELASLVPEGYTMAQMAMRWILDHPAVTAIIPGASSPEQVRANAAVSDLTPLPEDLHRALADFYQSRVKQHIRGVY